MIYQSGSLKSVFKGWASRLKVIGDEIRKAFSFMGQIWAENGPNMGHEEVS